MSQMVWFLFLLIHGQEDLVSIFFSFSLLLSQFTVSYTNTDNVHRPPPLIRPHQRVQSIDYLVDYLDLEVLVNDTIASSCICE